jgi:hypothetical protein
MQKFKGETLLDRLLNVDYKLRCRPDASEVLTIVLPVVTVFIRHGETRISVDMDRIEDYLQLTTAAKKRLALMLESPRRIKTRIPLMRLDYGKLATEYQGLINSGHVGNRAELARFLNVSRAWVTKVLNRQLNLK